MKLGRENRKILKFQVECEYFYYVCFVHELAGKKTMLDFSHSAILYLNDNFDGGELFFTNRDAKTVTVSRFLTPGPCHLTIY